MANPDGSSVQAFRHLQAGSGSAADKIYNRFLLRLTALARSRLTPTLARRVDPEDVVQSAYRSFFVGAADDRFSITESGQLWSLLVTITLRKVYRTVEFHTAAKRSIAAEVETTDAVLLSQLAAHRDPDPAEAAALADEVYALLKSLSDRDRRIVELCLQGHRTAEIAVELDLSQRSVRRIVQQVEQSLQLRRHQIESNAPSSKSGSVRDNAEPGPATYSRQAAQQTDFRRRFQKPQPPVWQADYDDHADRLSFSDFVLQRMIGQGGLGKVYIAERKSDHRKVAVKFLQRRVHQSPRAVQQLLIEADVLKKLSHANVVRLLGTGRTRGGTYFLVMTLINGRSLDRLPARASWQTVLSWAADLAAALAYVHSQGIVHCDLKPSNVIVRSNNRAVLADFGLAQSILPEGLSRPALAGTAAWMAPEQVDLLFGPISTATDIYGFGATLYSLLCGRPPYQGIRAADIFAQLVSGADIVAPGHLNPDVPRGLQNLVVQCLQRRPADRPRNAEELSRRIAAIAQENQRFLGPAEGEDGKAGT